MEYTHHNIIRDDGCGYLLHSFLEGHWRPTSKVGARRPARAGYTLPGKGASRNQARDNVPRSLSYIRIQHLDSQAAVRQVNRRVRRVSGAISAHFPTKPRFSLPSFYLCRFKFAKKGRSVPCPSHKR